MEPSGELQMKDINVSEVEALGRMYERIIREEVRAALKAPPAHRWAELITDPGSRELSMSRLCIGVLVGNVSLVIWAAVFGIIKPEMVAALGNLLTSTVVSVASIYGANSVANAWQSGKLQAQAKEIWEKARGWMNTPSEAEG